MTGIWLHMGLSDHRARRFLENAAMVPAEARAFLQGGEDRIQIHLTPTGAYGVLPDLEQDFSDQSMAVGRLGFWLDSGHLITVRRHPLRGIDALRDAVNAGLELSDPAQGLARLQMQYAELLEKRLAVLASSLDHIEDLVLADKEGFERLPLGPARRELSRHHRELASLRSAILRAASGRNGPSHGPLPAHLPLLLQETEDLERDAAALQDRGRLLYEEVGTRISTIANRSLSALTVISTLLLPPTFVVGAFGMNVEGLPWAHDAAGFAIVLGVCLLLVIVLYAGLRRLRVLP